MMIDSYGVNGGEHVWLGLDPGLTTGWALVGDDGKMLGSGTFTEDNLFEGLDKLIRGSHRSGRTMTVVVEKMPSTGSMSDLAQRLEHVRGLITELVEEVYDLPTQQVAPGEWKTSRVGRGTKLRGEIKTVHARDAATMTLYAIDKENRRAN